MFFLTKEGPAYTSIFLRSFICQCVFPSPKWEVFSYKAIIPWTPNIKQTRAKPGAALQTAL